MAINSGWKPFLHLDRTRNVLGLSRDDLEKMARCAKDNPSLYEAMEHAKMLWLLADNNGRRDDSLCYPEHLNPTKEEE